LRDANAARATISSALNLRSFSFGFESNAKIFKTSSSMDWLMKLPIAGMEYCRFHSKHNKGLYRLAKTLHTYIHNQLGAEGGTCQWV
jgi:hypothetical protein